MIEKDLRSWYALKIHSRDDRKKGERMICVAYISPKAVRPCVQDIGDFHSHFSSPYTLSATLHTTLHFGSRPVVILVFSARREKTKMICI